MLEHAVQGVVRVAAAIRLLQIRGGLMGQIASLRAEARVLHDGRGAAPCRRQRSGGEQEKESGETFFMRGGSFAVFQ